MTETQLTNILSAFYRHGRRGFVPLTAEELDRAAGTHHNTRTALVKRGLLSSDGDRACPSYDITETGREIVLKHVDATRRN
jgi:hypothetical protein